MAEIRLGTSGKFAIVDDADFDALIERDWHLNGRYARTTTSEHRRYMHQVILGAVAGQEVDHINGDGLDNRRANLRLANRAEQTRNRVQNSTPHSSQFKGVIWQKNVRRWLAQIACGGPSIPLGTYKNEIDAAIAYDAAARFYHGEFARTNFPGTEALSREAILDRCRAFKGHASRFRGVTKHEDGKWAAYVFRDRKHRHLGLFDREEDAALARDRAAGPKAILNFPVGT